MTRRYLFEGEWGTLPDSAPKAKSALALTVALNAVNRIPGLTETEQRISDYNCAFMDMVHARATAPARKPQLTTGTDRDAQLRVEAREERNERA